MLTQKDNWWVPEIDKVCLKAVLYQSQAIDHTLFPFIKNTKNCIQAGGNIGIWAKKFSYFFEHVHTFEPDKENYEALCKNLEDNENITSYNVGLGSRNKKANLIKVNPENIGAHYLSNDGVGDIEIITIDSLNLENVGLIQLDIEGGEHDALLGAMQTIQRYSPVLCLEIKGFGKRFGKSDLDTFNLIFDGLGYQAVKIMNRDWIFTKK